MALCAPSDPKIPAIAAAGMAKTTSAEHGRMLARLALLPGDLLDAPAAHALILHLSRERKKRKWRWTSTVKNACVVQGALSLLPAYRQVQSGVRLGESPLWRLFMRSCMKQAKQELPKQPKAATWAQVRQVLDNPSLPLPLFAAITLAWHSAQRTGDILQLQSSDVSLQPDGTMILRIRKGKVASIRGAYTVNTPALPPAHRIRLASFLAARAASLCLFTATTTGPAIKLALRSADAELEQRSLRRGALQALAAEPGMTDAVLLLFSGHTNVTSLRRYLNWGTKAIHTRVEMVVAAGGALTR